MELESLITDLQKRGDSIGARINVVVTGMFPGLGEPVFNRLDASLTQSEFAKLYFKILYRYKDCFFKPKEI